MATVQNLFDDAFIFGRYMDEQTAHVISELSWVTEVFSITHKNS